MKKWFRAALNIKHLICIIITICVFTVMIFLTSESLVSLERYNSFLSSRNYNYSIEIDKDIEQDTYAYYNKTITFTHNNKLINSVVLMDTQGQHTENDLLNGFDLSLEEYEVAISANIASINNLNIGSIIQSKSKITNKLNDYKVIRILPDIYGIDENDNDRSKGIIITGKSDEYLNNIDVNYIYFYNTDSSLINSKGANIVGKLNDIEVTKSKVFGMYALELAIVLIVSLVISVLFNIVILSFNKLIYLKRKEFGVSNLYNQIKIDLLVYSLSVSLITLIVFTISSIFVRFSLALMLIEIIPFIVVSFGSYFVLKNYIRRR
jgi:hypothetical protein